MSLQCAHKKQKNEQILCAKNNVFLEESVVICLQKTFCARCYLLRIFLALKHVNNKEQSYLLPLIVFIHSLKYFKGKSITVKSSFFTKSTFISDFFQSPYNY